MDTLNRTGKTDTGHHPGPMSSSILSSAERSGARIEGCGFASKRRNYLPCHSEQVKNPQGFGKVDLFWAKVSEIPRRLCPLGTELLGMT